MKRNYRAIIFDRDGVLAHFHEEKIAAVLETQFSLSMHELQDSFNQVEKQKGFPKNPIHAEEMIRDFWNKLGEQKDLPENIVQELKQFDFYQFMQPFAEVPQVLATLAAQGWSIGVLSNYTYTDLEQSLRKMDLMTYITSALSPTIINCRKPEPAAYLSIARELAVQPAECLYFDDEPDLVAGARALGMTAYLVDRQLTEQQIDQYQIKDLTAVFDIVSPSMLTKV